MFLHPCVDMSIGKCQVVCNIIPHQNSTKCVKMSHNQCHNHLLTIYVMAFDVMKSSKPKLTKMCQNHFHTQYSKSCTYELCHVIRCHLYQIQTNVLESFPQSTL